MEYDVRRRFVSDSSVVAHAYSTLRSLPETRRMESARAPRGFLACVGFQARRIPREEIGPGAIRHAPPTRCPTFPAKSRNPLVILSRGIRRAGEDSCRVQVSWRTPIPPYVHYILTCSKPLDDTKTIRHYYAEHPEHRDKSQLRSKSLSHCCIYIHPILYLPSL